MGLRTSPAVKVTLFQASDENSAPTIATPTSRTVSTLQFALRQKPVKLLGDRRGIASHQEARGDQPEQRRHLGDREDVLHGRAGAEAARVDPRQKDRSAGSPEAAAWSRRACPLPTR